MNGKKITLNYDPKEDRLIITNVSRYISLMVSKLQELKSGKSLSVNVDDIKMPKFGDPRKGAKIIDKIVREVNSLPGRSKKRLHSFSPK